jgi:hypothetical protein
VILSLLLLLLRAAAAGGDRFARRKIIILGARALSRVETMIHRSLALAISISVNGEG